jgi:hypothetical protein
MGAGAAAAAQATLACARTLWPGMTYANIGVTPMVGQNDDPAEVFTEADAQTLVSFATQNHLGWAGWPSGRWTGTSRAAARPAACPPARRSAGSRWTSRRSS